MNIITADQIQQGDKIRVTRVEQDGDRKSTRIYEGVAHEFDPGFGFWRTEETWNLFTDRRNSVIELLDRPKPKIVLPTGEHAVIQYRRGSTLWTGRFDGQTWHLSGNGNQWTFYPLELSDMLNESDSFGPRTDYKALFEGVAK